MNKILGIVIAVIVLVGGGWFLINSQDASSDVSVNADSEVINTSDWKTYKNEKYKFEVKYPNNYSFNISSDLSKIDITHQRFSQDETGIYPAIGITVLDNPNNISVEDWIESELAKKGNSYILPINWDVINGENFARLPYGCFTNCMTYFVTNDENLYEINYGTYRDLNIEQNNNDKNDFEQIISTFKFIR